MIFTEQDHRKAEDELQHLQQWLVQVQRDYPDPAKRLTKGSIRKMIARLSQELAAVLAMPKMSDFELMDFSYRTDISTYEAQLARLVIVQRGQRAKSHEESNPLNPPSQNPTHPDGCESPFDGHTTDDWRLHSC